MRWVLRGDATGVHVFIHNLAFSSAQHAHTYGRLSVEQANKIPLKMKVGFVISVKQKEPLTVLFSPINWLWNVLVTAPVFGCLRFDTLAPVLAFGI